MANARFAELPVVLRRVFLLLCGLCALTSVFSAWSPVVFAQTTQQQETVTNKAGEAPVPTTVRGVPRGSRAQGAKSRGAEANVGRRTSARFALVGGSMAVQGWGLTTAQIADLAEFLTGRLPVKEQIPASAMCPADTGQAFDDPLARPHWSYSDPAAPTSDSFLAFDLAAQLDRKIGGGLFALKLETGEIAWQTPHPGCGEAPGPGAVRGGNRNPRCDFFRRVGRALASSAQNGHIVWDVDTVKDYKTANGVKAHGGALNGPGAVVVGGMLYVNSGYAFLGGAPGNVLLAFSVDGK